MNSNGSLSSQSNPPSMNTLNYTSLSSFASSSTERHMMPYSSDLYSSLGGSAHASSFSGNPAAPSFPSGTSYAAVAGTQERYPVQPSAWRPPPVPSIASTSSEESRTERTAHSTVPYPSVASAPQPEIQSGQQHPQYLYAHPCMGHQYDQYSYPIFRGASYGNAAPAPVQPAPVQQVPVQPAPMQQAPGYWTDRMGPNPRDSYYMVQGGAAQARVSETGVSKTRPFACPYCPKRFKKRFHLTRHQTCVHTMDKRYACKICKKRFARSDMLRTHNRIHEREQANKGKQQEDVSDVSSAKSDSSPIDVQAKQAPSICDSEKCSSDSRDE